MGHTDKSLIKIYRELMADNWNFRSELKGVRGRIERDGKLSENSRFDLLEKVDNRIEELTSRILGEE